MNYAFEHDGKTYTPNGTIEVGNVEAHNRELEAREIEWLKTGPDKVFLYVHPAGSRQVSYSRGGGSGERSQSHGPYSVRTWLGTVLDSHAVVGAEVWSNLDRWTHKRAISCRIFGVLYHGWYMESSGDYCRLKKAKKR